MSIFKRFLLIGTTIVFQTAIAQEDSGMPMSEDDCVREAPWCGMSEFPVWTTKLDKGSVAERRRAALALGILGTSDKMAVSALIHALDDADDSVAITAAVALGRIGPKAVAATAALAETLGDQRFYAKPGIDDLELRFDLSPVAQALAKIGEPAVTVLVTKLSDGSRELRGQAAHALSLMGHAARSSVPALTKALQDQSFWVRRDAVQALGRIGPDAKKSIPFLQAALRGLDPSDGNRDVILLALSRLGSSRLPDLQKAILEKQHSEIAFLSTLGIGSRLAVPSLIGSLRNEDYEIRTGAFEALGKIGPGAASAVPELIRYIETDGYIEPFEANALGRIGEAARPAVPVMLRLARKSDPATREVVVCAVSEIDTDGTRSLELLVADLEAGSTPVEVKIQICRALGRLGPAAATAAPSLVGAAKAGDREARAEAIIALGRLGRAAALATVPVLIEFTKQDDGLARLESIIALGRIGHSASAATPALIQRTSALRSSSKPPDQFERLMAVTALGRLGPAAAQAVPTLVDMVRHDVPFEPCAVLALARIDPRALSALEPAIEERTRRAPPRSIGDVMLLAAALQKECAALKNYLGLMLDQLEDDLVPGPEDERGYWVEAARRDLDVLTQYGYGSRPAIARLMRLRAKAHPLVKRWIEETITKIIIN